MVKDEMCKYRTDWRCYQKYQDIKSRTVLINGCITDFTVCWDIWGALVAGSLNVHRDFFKKKIKKYKTHFKNTHVLEQRQKEPRPSQWSATHPLACKASLCFSLTHRPDPSGSPGPEGSQSDWLCQSLCSDWTEDPMCSLVVPIIPSLPVPVQRRAWGSFLV